MRDMRINVKQQYQTVKKVEPPRYIEPLDELKTKKNHLTQALSLVQSVYMPEPVPQDLSQALYRAIDDVVAKIGKRI